MNEMSLKAISLARIKTLHCDGALRPVHDMEQQNRNYDLFGYHCERREATENANVWRQLTEGSSMN